MAYYNRHILPNNTHGITGVKLNEISVKRPSLSFEDAVTAHILAKQGFTYTETVQLLGTNAHRIGEVFRGEEHKGSADEALRLLTT